MDGRELANGNSATDAANDARDAHDDIPCDRVSPRFARLLRTAAILRGSRGPLTIDEIADSLADADQGEGRPPSGRTIRRDLALFASLGAVTYLRGHASQGPSRWKWRGGRLFS